MKKMFSIINNFRYKVEDTNNKKPEIIFCILGLHTQLMFAIEQQLERLRSLDLSQFANETEFYESNHLDSNVLEDLGFDRFDGYIPEYIQEYATVTKQQPNYTTSITSIRAAINELENLLAIESNPTFEDLIIFSETELNILCDQIIKLIKKFNNYYPHVGILNE